MLDAAGRETLVHAVEAAAAACDAMLLADYGLGVLPDDVARRAIDACRARGIPVVVDSRYRAFAFRGATVATPNEVEAMAALGLESETELLDGKRLARSLSEAGIENVLVTRGSKGMVVCGPRGEVTSIGIAGSRQATDVTGAGDTVAASGVAGAGRGGLARRGGAYGYLRRRRGGYETRHRHRLTRRGARPDRNGRREPFVKRSAARIFHDLPDLCAFVASSRARRVVLANGCFDPLHVGHTRYLADAKLHGDFLVVAVNDDAGARRLKGDGRPVVPADDRARLVAALDAVDAVLVFADDDVVRILETLRPQVHAKGTDYTTETVPERAAAVQLGIETVITGDAKTHASREVVARLRATGAPRRRGRSPPHDAARRSRGLAAARRSHPGDTPRLSG